MTSQSNKRPPDWEVASSLFLCKIPKAREWRNRQLKVGLQGVKEYEDTIQRFLGQHGVAAEKEPCENMCDVVDRAKYYASLVSSASSKEIPQELSDFLALILLSLCAVLEQKKVASETIDEIVQQITGAGMYARTRIRRGAIWVNRLISELTKRKMNIGRATELLFISMLC